MSRLTLDHFKKKTGISKEKIEELEKLTGGILASCHCPEPSNPPTADDIKVLNDILNK